MKRFKLKRKNLEKCKGIFFKKKFYREKKRKAPIPKFHRKKKAVFFNKTNPKKHEPWRRKLKPKFGSHVKLMIDARVNSIPKFKRNLTNKQKMLKIYNPRNLPQGSNFFIPTMPVRRHPQLQKIETYFVNKILLDFSIFSKIPLQIFFLLFFL